MKSNLYNKIIVVMVLAWTLTFPAVQGQSFYLDKLTRLQSQFEAAQSSVTSRYKFGTPELTKESERITKIYLDQLKAAYAEAVKFNDPIAAEKAKSTMLALSPDIALPQAGSSSWYEGDWHIQFSNNTARDYKIDSKGNVHFYKATTSSMDVHAELKFTSENRANLYIWDFTKPAGAKFMPGRHERFTKTDTGFSVEVWTKEDDWKHGKPADVKGVASRNRQ